MRAPVRAASPPRRLRTPFAFPCVHWTRPSGARPRSETCCARLQVAVVLLATMRMQRDGEPLPARLAPTASLCTC